MTPIFDILAAVGGLGVITIAVIKFTADLVKNKVEQRHRVVAERRIERYRQQASSRRTQVDKYLTSQFDVYLELWSELQSLRLMVDAVWDKATKRNISALAKQLQVVDGRVRNWSLLFEESHFNELIALIENLELFEAGKVTLWDLRNGDYDDHIVPELAAAQIEENQDFKERFDETLERLRISFRSRLSTLDAELANG